jgi:hypothetical protein
MPQPRFRSKKNLSTEVDKTVDNLVFPLLGPFFRYGCLHVVFKWFSAFFAVFKRISTNYQLPAMCPEADFFKAIRLPAGEGCARIAGLAFLEAPDLLEVPDPLDPRP